MQKYSLESIEPRATCTPCSGEGDGGGGRQIEFVHGDEPEALVKRTMEIGYELLSSSQRDGEPEGGGDGEAGGEGKEGEGGAYEVQYLAVPYEQERKHNKEEQRETLWKHPEKKALTLLLDEAMKVKAKEKEEEGGGTEGARLRLLLGRSLCV